MWSPSRPTNNSPQPSAEAGTNSVPSRNAAPMANSRQHNEGSTYIGKSLVIKGEVSGSEPIHIEGRIEGPISLRDAHLNIGRDAIVTSNVQAGEVIVRGTLHGNVTAVDRVEVHSGGSLMGNVAAGRVTIESGAYCKGSIDMRRPDPKPHLQVSGKSEGKPHKIDESEHSPELVTY
jgi:cytoskeletal protein CcmA (bactofilin family)